MLKERFTTLYNLRSGEVTGTLFGAGVAVLILLFGLFRMIFIVICAGIGCYVGSKLSKDKNYVRNLLDKILPPGTYK